MTEKKEKAEETPQAEPAEESLEDLRRKEFYLRHGVDPKAVERWKGIYGKISAVPITGNVYVYRGLSRSEYTQLMGTLDVTQGQAQATLGNQEQTVKRTVLYPPSEVLFGRLKQQAGLAVTLSDLVFKLSGFGSDEEPLEL